MAWTVAVRRFFLSLCLVSSVCTASSLAKKKPPEKPVNVNTANAEELQQVPGIGPATAQKILQMRKSYGPFKSVDDLLAIRGLGEKSLNKMRKYLTVGNASRPKSLPSATNPGTSTRPPEKPPGNEELNTNLVMSLSCNRAIRFVPDATSHSWMVL